MERKRLEGTPAEVMDVLLECSCYCAYANSHERSSKAAGLSAMIRSARRARAATVRSPRWLSAKELDAWRSLTLLIARLPTALEEQLQRDARLSYIEYYA